MNRRTFIKTLLSSTAALAGMELSQGPLLFRTKGALAFSGKTLVVVFQRGGCDGLNLCVPFGDENYHVLRPTIAISPPGGNPGESALDLDGFFGFHPRMSGLHALFKEGRLAVFPAVHYPNASRSHFDSEVIIESGSDKKLYSGWLNRYLGATGDEKSPLRAASIGTSLVHALKGEAPASVLDDLSSFGFGRGDFQQELRTRLRSALKGLVEGKRQNLGLLKREGLVMLDDLDLMEGLQRGGYQPENGASYPSGSFGRQLMLTARLIKAGLGLEIVCIDHGGWDTHSQQASRQASRIEELSRGLSAFYADLGGLGTDVLTLTMTEFGRTARENGSRGTDHGNASCWMAMGGAVKGGIFGTWPGLAQDRLYLGRYLAYSIDFRNILAEVLTQHLGFQDIPAVLPDFQASAIGFL